MSRRRKKNQKKGGKRKMCEWNEAKGGEKLFDGVILFKEYFDVLGGVSLWRENRERRVV